MNLDELNALTMLAYSTPVLSAMQAPAPMDPVTCPECGGRGLQIARDGYGRIMRDPHTNAPDEVECWYCPGNGVVPYIDYIVFVDYLEEAEND